MQMIYSISLGQCPRRFKSCRSRDFFSFFLAALLGEVASLESVRRWRRGSRTTTSARGRRAARSARAVPELGRHRLDLPVLAFAAASAFFTSSPPSACPFTWSKNKSCRSRIICFAINHIFERRVVHFQRFPPFKRILVIRSR